MSLEQPISLCIPRVLSDTTRETIKTVFQDKLGLGEVDTVDLIPVKGYDVNRAYIRFKSWKLTSQAQTLKIGRAHV